MQANLPRTSRMIINDWIVQKSQNPVLYSQESHPCEIVNIEHTANAASPKSSPDLHYAPSSTTAPTSLEM